MKTVAEHPASVDGQSIPVTISVGIAFFRPGDRGYEDAMKRADKALYRSKSEGRNRATMEP